MTMGMLKFKSIEDARAFAMSPSSYNPTQQQMQNTQRLAIYKGGVVQDLELPTRAKDLLELENRVYTQQLLGKKFGDWIRKLDVDVTTGATFGSPAWLNVLYGRKAWECVNHEANAFAMLPKEAWGHTGWRVECGEAGGDRYGGVDEKGHLPDTIAPDYEEVSTRPRTVMHGFDLSQIADLISGKDDTLDILPELREKIGAAHRHIINTMLLCNVTTLPVSPDTGATHFESIDRVVSSFAEVTLCGDVNAGDSDIYGIDRDAAAQACYDAIVSHNSNVDRDLTLALVDNLWQQLVVGSGATPDVIITGGDTLMTWSQLLEAERRFFSTARLTVPAYGGVRGVAAGVDAAFFVALYNGIPILTSQDVVVDTISRIYFLDTDFLKFATLQPTKYMETQLDEDMIYMNKLGREGYYQTIGELRCYCFNKQGKIRDLR